MYVTNTKKFAPSFSERWVPFQVEFATTFIITTSQI